MNQYGVLSEDGVAYRVGIWKDGKWIPGTLADALRERDLLRKEEPNAYVVVLEGTLRLAVCVRAWPEAHLGGSDRRCCRFPKPCSPYPYDRTPIAEGVLEDEP